MIVFDKPKRALLKREIVIAELSSKDSKVYDEDITIFEQGSYVYVLGIGYQTEKGRMMIIYSFMMDESTTVLEKYLDYVMEGI